MSNFINKIDALCKRYKFRYDELGAYIKIKSKYDTWYIENNEDLAEYDIYHENTLKLTRKGRVNDNHWHRQKNKSNKYLKLKLDDVFNYIKRHDKKREKRKYI